MKITEAMKMIIGECRLNVRLVLAKALSDRCNKYTAAKNAILSVKVEGRQEGGVGEKERV